MADVTFNDLPGAAGIDGSADYFPINTASPAATNKINRNTFLGVTGQPVDISTVQTLSNKVLGNTNTVTLKDTLFTLQDDGDTTKQAKFQLSGITTATTRTYTLPNASSTLADIATAQTFTNKTLTSPAITGGTITNSTISVDAIAEFTAANGVTVDGMNIKDGKLNTNNSVVTSNVTDTAITPAKLQAGTGSGWTSQTWTSPIASGVTSGNGTTNYAKYIQTGKRVNSRLGFTLGNTSAITGAITFTLPVTSATSYVSGISPIGYAILYDNGTAFIVGTVVWVSTTTCKVESMNAGGSFVFLADTSATSPFTWTTADGFFIELDYEGA